MPYPSNAPRFEFGSTDRTTLFTIAQTAINMMQSPPVRSTFDAWASQILGLSPTYKYQAPLPDKI